MNTKEATTACLAVIGALVLIPVLAIFEGWALTEVWRLLLIPSAMDYAEIVIKPLSIGVAIAIAYTLRSFVSASSKDESKGKGYAVIFMAAIAKPFVTVFFAWVLALFIFGGR